LPLLSVTNLTKSFGGIRAVTDLSFEVEQGEIFGLIGPNGSGKTVTINCVAGSYSPDSGRIVFDGKEITGSMPHQVARFGINRTYQLTRIYPNLSVSESLLFAAQPKSIGSGFRSFIRSLYRRYQQSAMDHVDEVLRTTGLETAKGELARNLSYGQQKTLEFACLLVINPLPRMLLLDEPTAGLQASEVEGFMDTISRLRKQGMTFLVIEHNLRFIMKICDRITVLNYGKKIAEGLPDEVRKHEEVIKAYLGR